MTAQDIIIKRTGMSTEDAEYYESISETKVRLHLGLDDGDDLSPYIFQIADIAVLLWQQDSATKNTSITLGYESHSFSEGGVSESISGANGQSIWQTYTDAINDVLSTLNGVSAGVVRFI